MIWHILALSNTIWILVLPANISFVKEILAFLPINKKSFSLVWSLNNKFKNKSDKEIKILILKKLNRILLKKMHLKLVI